MSQLTEQELKETITPMLKSIAALSTSKKQIDDLAATLTKLCMENHEVGGDTSDGYHTFDELYKFRMLYNAVLFNAWGIEGENDVHKSWYHSDGELAFGGGWFIVVAELPTGQISQHYEEKYWD